ncbi:MAG: hypothetical protein JWN82_582 [Candidatus Saccharibacteria bacterium]|nr:hypothetical protein [Candidatus Saccharibacteria bacterium]
MRSILSDSRGVAHILVAVVVVVAIAGFGTYQFVKSNADSFSQNGGKATITPVKATPAPVKAVPAPVAAAPAAATEVNAIGQKVAAPNATKCAQLGRVWSQNICAWSSSRQLPGNKFCVDKSFAYYKNSPYDICSKFVAW